MNIDEKNIKVTWLFGERQIKTIVQEELINDSIASFRALTQEDYMRNHQNGQKKWETINSLQDNIDNKLNEKQEWFQADEELLNSDIHDFIRLEHLQMMQLNGIVPFLQHKLNESSLLVKDIKNLSVIEFSNFNHVTLLRIDQYIQLKREIIEAYKTVENLNLIKKELGSYYSSIEVAYNIVPDSIVAGICKNRTIASPSIANILQYCRNKNKDKYLKFYRQLINHLSEFSLHQLLQGESGWIRSEIPNLTFHLLEEILIRDLYNYIKKYANQERGNSKRNLLIFLKVHGIVTPSFIPEIIAQRLNDPITQQRVDQINKELLNEFSWFMIIPPYQIRSLLEEYPIKLIDSTKMPQLFSLFNNNRENMRKFLCTIARDSRRFTNGETNEHRALSLLLKNFFINNGFPITKERVIEGLSCLLPENNLDNLSPELVYQYLLREGIVSDQNIHSQLCVIPKRLAPEPTQHTTKLMRPIIAHILASEPRGMHWKDVLQVLNRMNVGDQINTGDQAPERLFSSNENIFMSDKDGRNTVYTHIKFLKDIFSSKAEYNNIVEAAFKHIKVYFQKENKCVETLENIYPALPEEFKGEIDNNIFILRAIVRSHSGKWDIYFSGSNNNNTVSYKREQNNYSVEKRIISLLQESNYPMKSEDIAIQIGSGGKIPSVQKSISEMCGTGELFIINHSFYTTKDKGLEMIGNDKFRNELITFIKSFIDENLSNGLICETSFITELINERFDKIYSKSLITSFIKAHKDDFEILCSRNLFTKCADLEKYSSTQKILSEVLSDSIDSLSIDECSEKLKDILIITKAALKRHLFLYKQQSLSNEEE